MLNNANEAQLRAITHTEGPMLVLAGPGSGKTTVITQRIKYLIEEKNISPETILVITFTKAAAKEMQQRFIKLTDNKIYPVSFGTFHAIFFQILRYTYRFDSKNIIREYEKANLISEIIKQIPDELFTSINNNPFVDNNLIEKTQSISEKINEEKENLNNPENIEFILSEISKIKNSNQSLDLYEESILTKSQFEYVYQEYKNQMSSLKKLDFDDMVLLCHNLLSSRSEILSIWQNKFKYILIDEFQDISPMQYEVVKLLSKPEDNLFIVGDDDQSIYGFRGASPEIMLSFENDYPNTEKVLLGINYRSYSDIVKYSSNLISKNQKRFKKKINAFNKADNGVKLYYFKNKEQQNESIIQLIKQYVQEKDGKYSDIAIIYRTNNNSIYLSEKLKKSNIPIKQKEKSTNIYNTPVAKDIISYLRFGLNQENLDDFYRIMNKPVRYIKKYTVPLKPFKMEELLQNNKTEDYVIHNILQLYKDLNFISTMTPFAAVNYIQKGIGYEKYINSQAKQSQNFQKYIEESNKNMNILLEEAKEFKTIEAWLEYIENYSNLCNKDESEDSNSNAVNIVTMHASKGLEWDVVILPDVNEGTVPHKKAVTDDDIEEERRMFYVAMTRAKKNLFIFSLKEERAENILPSRFINELFD